MHTVLSLLLHQHCNNSVIVPMPMKLSWRIWQISLVYNPYKAKQSETLVHNFRMHTYLYISVNSAWIVLCLYICLNIFKLNFFKWVSHTASLQQILVWLKPIGDQHSHRSSCVDDPWCLGNPIGRNRISQVDNWLANSRSFPLNIVSFRSQFKYTVHAWISAIWWFKHTALESD